MVHKNGHPENKTRKRLKGRDRRGLGKILNQKEKRKKNTRKNIEDKSTKNYIIEYEMAFYVHVDGSLSLEGRKVRPWRLGLCGGGHDDNSRRTKSGEVRLRSKHAFLTMFQGRGFIRRGSRLIQRGY